MGQAQLQLGRLGRDSARVSTWAVGERGLRADVVRQRVASDSYCEKPPDNADRLRSLLHQGAGRSPAARRGRLSDLRALRYQTCEVRPGPKPHHLPEELR